MLTFEDMKKGPVRASTKIHIDLLDMEMEIYLVPSGVYQAYMDDIEDRKKQQEMQNIIVAESISGQSNLTPEQAVDLMKEVQPNFAPAIWIEICTKVVVANLGIESEGKD